MFAFDTDEDSMVSMAVPTNRTSHRQVGVILFTMSLGVFIAQLDSQVVNLAIKAIGSDLNAGITRCSGCSIPTICSTPRCCSPAEPLATSTAAPVSLPQASD
jgi:hypothetical protein